MLENITYYTIIGVPLIVYLGVAVLASLLVTASIAVMVRRGRARIGFKWHFRAAYVTIALALLHGTLGLLAYL